VQTKAGHWLMVGSQTGNRRGVKVQRGEAITGMFSGHPCIPLVLQLALISPLYHSETLKLEREKNVSYSNLYYIRENINFRSYII
jgi:hypothetical protein